MFKKIFISGFLLLSFLVNGQGKIKWQAVFKYKEIFTDKKKAWHDSLLKNDAFYRSMQKDMRRNVYNKTYLMSFNDSISTFKQKYFYDDPELKELFYEKHKDKYLYKNIKQKRYLQIKSYIYSKNYTIIDSIPDFHWQITKETKQIGKYLVIKATGEEERILMKDGKIVKKKNKITAWFTPEIPISNGPDWYGGLPGFILELHAGPYLYLINEIHFQPKTKELIRKPKIHKEYGGLVNFLKKRKKVMEEFKKRYKNRRNSNKDWWK